MDWILYMYMSNIHEFLVLIIQVSDKQLQNIDHHLKIWLQDKLVFKNHIFIWKFLLFQYQY